MRRWLLGWMGATVALAACGDDGETSTGGSGGAGGGPIEEQIEPGPAGLRKLTSRQYVASVRVLLGDAAATAAQPPSDGQLFGLEAIAASDLSLSAAQVEAYERSARLIATAAVGDPAAYAALVPCTPASETDQACLTQVANRFGRLAWRRPISDVERSELVAAGVAGAEGYGSFEAGVATLVSAALQSPDFLYQVELGETDAPDLVRRPLLQWELASRLSFFILGQTPSEDLLDLAEAGELGTPEQIREVAISLVAQQRARNALDDFYSEVFKLRDTASIQKDPALYPLFTDATRAALAEETRLFLNEIVWTNDADALSIFDAPFTYVNEDNAWIYGVTVTGKEFQRIDVANRRGVLTQSSFLARAGHPGETSPTRRGKFVAEQLLCQTIPPPPPGTIPSIPPDDGMHRTMRDRLAEVINEDSCKACHNRMDPIGLALESFDGVGVFRADDQGLPLDLTGEVVGLGPFNGASGLGEAIRNYDGVTGCMVRQLYRQSMGHLEYQGEEPAIQAIAASFDEGGHRVQSLLVEIASSPAFRLVGDPK